MDLIKTLFYVLLEKNTLGLWITAIASGVVLLVTLRIGRNIASRKLKRLALRTKNTLDDLLADLLARTQLLVLLMISLWFASKLLVLPARTTSILDTFALLSLLLQVAVWGNVAIGYFIQHFVRLEVVEKSSQIATSSALTFIGKLALWSVVLLLALDNLGINISTLVTTLGVGGIAIALAAQNILGDLFASLSIVFDKPFVVGDSVVVDDLAGTVERIGLKTTRVRSLSGEQLIFSNSDLLRSRIKNYKRMEQRRASFTIGVTYQTSYETLESIPSMIRRIIEQQEGVRFERSHFKSYSPASLDFETVYWVTKPDYGVFMDIQQKVNLELFRLFAEEGIEFAYPTQTVHLVQTGEQK